MNVTYWGVLNNYITYNHFLQSGAANYSFLAGATIEFSWYPESPNHESQPNKFPFTVHMHLIGKDLLENIV